MAVGQVDEERQKRGFRPDRSDAPARFAPDALAEDYRYLALTPPKDSGIRETYGQLVPASMAPNASLIRYEPHLDPA